MKVFIVVEGIEQQVRAVALCEEVAKRIVNSFPHLCLNLVTHEVIDADLFKSFMEQRQ